MVKVIELIVVLALLVFSFFAGVKYSDSVRERASWLFESKEEEVELPDLSGENPAEAGAPMDENGVNLENPAAAPAAAPMDNIDAAPAAAPVAPAAPVAAPAPAAAPVAAPAKPAAR
jgi:hypothetical protein